MNMNRLISMIVRQLINVGMRKGISMATKGGAKKNVGGQAGQGTGANVKRSAKIARRVIR